MEPAADITEFGTGLRAHLGLDPQEIEAATTAVEVEPEPEELDVLVLLEAELIEREREVAMREAALSAQGGYAGVDELALARERRRARSGE